MGDKRKKSSMDEWKRYAELLDELDNIKFKLLDAIAGDVPKTVHSPGWDKIDEGETKLRSDLEDRMFQEHPDKASIDIFYGGKNE